MGRITNREADFEKDFNKNEIDSWVLVQALVRLKAYEDAEEQGLLAKVVHGEWIVTDEGVFVNQNTWRPEQKYSYNCSVCRYHTGNQGKRFNYCPNCGAKMDDKEEGVKNEHK